MADGDLASIFSGVDPTSAMQLQALQGQNIAAGATNPQSWNQGIFGGLARQLALGQGMSMAQGGVNQAVQANLAAQPDLAAAMASPNPLSFPAQNPNMDPVARARLLAAYGSPGARLQLGETQQAQAAATLQQTQAATRQLQNLPLIAGLQGQGLLPGGAPAPGTAPATATSGPGPRIGSGRMPVTNTATLPLDPVNVPPAQLPAFLNGLNPAQKQQAMARLRAHYNTMAPAPATSASATQ
jgi:hypothetical protein